MKTLLLFALLHGGDTAVTCQGLRHPEFREANPIVGQSCGRMVAVSAGVVALDVWFVRHYKDTHPTAVKWFTGLSIGVEGTAIVNNAILLHRLHATD